MSNCDNDRNKTSNGTVCPYISKSPTLSSSAPLDTSKAADFSLPQTKSAMAQAHHSTSTLLNTPQIYREPIPPTQAQINIVRYTWEHICDTRLQTDDPAVSPSHAFGLAFYDALFLIDPSLNTLFSDIFKQARALAGMIAYIVRAPMITGGTSYNDSKFCPPSPEKETLTIREINERKRKQSTATSFLELVTNAAAEATVEENEMDTEKLLDQLRELGARHYFYDVKPQHMELVGPAILQALKMRLGNEYLPEVAEAWASASAYATYHMTVGLDSQIAWEQGRRKSAIAKLDPASNQGRTSKANCTMQ